MGRKSKPFVECPPPEAYVLYEKYQDAAKAALWKFFPQYADDEDMQQIARIGLWRACCTYDPERGSFLTLAYLTVKSEVLHHFHIKSAKSKIPDYALVELDAPLGHRAARTHDPEQITLLDLIPNMHNRDWVDLEGYLNRLDDIHRETVLMRMQGYTLDEIGKVYGVSRERVRQRIAETRHLFAWYVG